MFTSQRSRVLSEKFCFFDHPKSMQIYPGQDRDGNYKLSVEVTPEGNLSRIAFEWSEAKLGTLSCSMVKLFLVAGSFSLDQPLLIASTEGGAFPTSSSGKIETEDGFQFHMTAISAQVLLEFDGMSPPNTQRLKRAVPAFTDIHSTRCPNNVRIYFPWTQSDLWTTEAALKGATNHFKVTLSPDYNEGQILTEIRNETSAHEKHFVDSDDEEEKASEFDEYWTESEASIKSEAPFKQIKVNDIAHSTYRAFLHWLQTSEIIFAPLFSNFRLSEDPTAEREAAIEKLITNPALPRPVSPKSVYRLADYYSIPTLRLLALDEIKSQLTVENIAFEVFGDLAKMYEEVREMEIDYAVTHWKEVLETVAMYEIERLTESGAIDISMVSLKLSRRLLA